MESIRRQKGQASNPSTTRTQGQNGARAGGLAGAVVFFSAGLVPVLIGTNFVLLNMAERFRFRGGFPEPGVILHLAVGLGTVLSALLVGSLFVIVGAMAGAALGRLHAFLGYSPDLAGKNATLQFEELVTRAHRRPSEAVLQGITERLGFLEGHGRDIRSVILVGSTAFNVRDNASDTDVVVICTNRGIERVRESIVEREIDDAMATSPALTGFELTVLGEQEIEQLTATGNPFAAVVAKGIPLRDDGFVRDSLRRAGEKRPGREYYLKTLYEDVVCQYLGSLKSVAAECRQKGCTPSCCRRRRDCLGLAHPATLRRTIMRMLYATLPAHGYLPLTRTDVLLFAEDVYDNENGVQLKEAIKVLRSRGQAFFYSDYLLLRDLARVLLRELVGLAGFDRDVRRILADARNLIDGRYAEIQDAGLRRCVS